MVRKEHITIALLLFWLYLAGAIAVLAYAWCLKTRDNSNAENYSAIPVRISGVFVIYHTLGHIAVPPESFREFELVASPPSWYEVAKDLNEQAAVLYRDRSTMIQFTNHKGVTFSRYGTNRGVFLLAGFSVENILKAFLIYENPAYISRGMLASELRTHRLTKLWQASRFIPYKNRYSKTVAALEDGLESWARYPCGLTHEGKSFENEMTAKLWSSYNGMFASCSKRLEHLLTKGWETSSGERSYMRYEHRA